MSHRYLDLLTTPAVVDARIRWSGADRYARLAGGPVHNDRLGPDEVAFVAERNGFYLASVSETGWPYVQFRGGPKGFLHVVDEGTLAFADLGGNRQYLTVGNVARDDRVSLFLMDYVHRARLKVLGHLAVVDDPELAARVSVEGAERIVRIRVAGFDWNCPRHIPVRYDEADVVAATGHLRERIAALEEENARLRAGRG